MPSGWVLPTSSRACGCRAPRTRSVSPKRRRSSPRPPGRPCAPPGRQRRGLREGRRRERKKEEKMLAIRGVYEVAIRVRDLDKAERFYRDVLGMDVGLRDERRRWVFLRA